METSTQIQKITVDGKIIVEIENFLSEQECDQLLSTRVSSFKKAASHYPKYYRNNNRLEEDNVKLSEDLLERVNCFQLEELRNVKRLNERLRFCEYTTGQQFTKHQDGVFYPSENEASTLTFLLYLNDFCEFKGGETQFFNIKTDDEVIHEVSPSKGKLVIFDHTLWHNGNKVIDGTKYVLRSDFIFENQTKSHHKGYIWCLTKLNDNTFLSGGRDTLIKHWNKELKLLNSFKLHEKSILKIANIGNGEFISSSRDLTLKKWNLKGEIITSVKVDSMVLTIATNDEFLITGNTNGEIITYTKDLQKLRSYSVHEGWIWDTLVIKNRMYSVSDDGTVRKTDKNGSTEVLINDDNGLFSLAFDGNSIYCGTQQGKLLKYSLATKTLVSYNYHQDIIKKILCGNEIITASEDNTVSVNGCTVQKHDNFVQDIIQMDDLIISAGFDGRLTRIDLV